MIAELEGLQDQLLSIRQDAPGIVARLTDEQFNWRPAARAWSIAECFEHLNTTAAAFVPLIDASITDARNRGVRSAGPFAYPLLQRALVRTMEPPPRLRLRTTRRFRPAGGRPVAAIMDEFERWQEAMEARIREADGIDLRRARTRSPFAPLLSYSLGTAFALFLAHERRHLWQARGVRNERSFPPAALAS